MMTTKTAKVTKIRTTWECWSYDVWGNAQDGYEVNDRTCFDRERVLYLTPETHNVGTTHEFVSAHPTEAQLRREFDLGKMRLDIDGDDLNIYITRARDGYPLGELRCTSHTSLSPIRPN